MKPTKLPQWRLTAPPSDIATLAKKYHTLRMAIKTLERQLDPVKTQLLAASPLGESLAGQWRILKTHHDETQIPAHVRSAYDSLKVEPAPTTITIKATKPTPRRR